MFGLPFTLTSRSILALPHVPSARNSRIRPIPLSSGGIYPFDDEASVKTFLEGPLAAQVTGHPALSNFNMKRFDVMDEITAITRGSVEVSMKA